MTIHKKLHGSVLQDNPSNEKWKFSTTCGEIVSYDEVTPYWKKVTCEKCLKEKDDT